MRVWGENEARSRDGWRGSPFTERPAATATAASLGVGTRLFLPLRRPSPTSFLSCLLLFLLQPLATFLATRLCCVLLL